MNLLRIFIFNRGLRLVLWAKPGLKRFSVIETEPLIKKKAKATPHPLTAPDWSPEHYRLREKLRKKLEARIGALARSCVVVA